MAEIVIALDVGEARIGLARGELGSPFAFGRGYLERTGDVDADVGAVAEVVLREGAERLVVGLPRRTDGRDSRQTQRVREFIASLKQAGQKVDVEDERFTTRLATSQILGSGRSRSSRREKGRVDEASAVLILETYLTRLARGAADNESDNENGSENGSENES
ncbi:MAG: Holliday junction resolvase RuvX [Trueperaceae bacterium]